MVVLNELLRSALLQCRNSWVNLTKNFFAWFDWKQGIGKLAAATISGRVLAPAVSALCKSSLIFLAVRSPMSWPAVNAGALVFALGLTMAETLATSALRHSTWIPLGLHLNFEVTNTCVVVNCPVVFCFRKKNKGERDIDFWNRDLPYGGFP